MPNSRAMRLLYLFGQIAQRVLHAVQDVDQFARVVAVLSADVLYLVDSPLGEAYFFP